MKKYFIFFLLVVIIHSTGKGQVGDPLLKDTLLKATQYSIPSSGAFTLLGVNPENVSTPGFSRDFKIDYLKAVELFFSGCSTQSKYCTTMSTFLATILQKQNN